MHDNQSEPDPNSIEDSTESVPPATPDGVSLHDLSRESKVPALLETVAGAYFNRLTNHARYRLDRVNLPTNGSEDLVQDAFLAILTGIGTKRIGRHPSEGDLASKATFYLYVQGVINSLVEALRRKREYYIPHDPMVASSDWADEAIPAFQIPAGDVPLTNLGLPEELEVFFQQLRCGAPMHLQPLIQAWEPEFLSADKIPIPTGCRRHRFELRRLAKQVLNELNRPRQRAADGAKPARFR